MRRSAMEPLGEIHVDTGRGYRAERGAAFPPPPFPTDEDHEVARIREECDHVRYLFCIYLIVTSSLELYCGQTIRPQSETRDPEEALYWRLRGRPGDGAKRNFSAHLNRRDWHRRTRGEDDLRNIPNRKERALALDSADPKATVLAWGYGPRWAVQRCADRVEGNYIRQSRAYNKDLQLNTRGGDDSPLRWFTSWKSAKEELERRRHEAEAEEERRRERERRERERQERARAKEEEARAKEEERQGKPRSKWTQKEDDLLIKSHKKLGNRWTEIASHLEGRTVQAVWFRLRRLKREEMGEEEWQRAKEERQRAKADEEELVRQRAKEIWQRAEEEERQRAKEDEEELVRQRAKLLLLAQAGPDASSDEGAFGGPEAEPPGTTPAWGAKKKRTKEPPAHRM
ncbi:hypothetical protein HKI87_14g78070 [Chloropicon roscoffensis]|uniref:Uncharacterized protein n=3 Tax=Chloropicon roscoffensis TaxID=1461544 RepID=A0AAX4PK11_9CHLO